MPRRILLLNTDLEIGGTPTVVRELAIRLHAPPEVVVDVACLKREGPVGGQLRAAGIRVTSLGAHSITDLPVVLARLVRLMRRGRVDRMPPVREGATLSHEIARLPYDTVFSFLLHANALAAMAKPFCGGEVRFLQSVQTTQPEPAWHWRVQAWVEAAAERVIVPSTSVADAASARSGIARSKLVVIPNAVDPAAFVRSPVPEADPRPYPLAFIGRFDPVKRIPDLLEAVELLDGLVRLDVYGGGPDVIREPIRSRVEGSPRLRSRVTFHGAVASPVPPLSQAGMLVLPSLAEGMPMVPIEAMAAGVPVVATDVPGTRDVVRHELNGLLVPANDPPRLAAAIRRIVEDVGLRRRLVAEGLRDAAARFSWPTAIASYRRLLDLSPND